MCAQANAQVVQAGMALNPLEKKESNSILHYQLAWVKSLTEQQYAEFEESVDRRMKNVLKMCDLEGFNIIYKQNSYLEASK